MSDSTKTIAVDFYKVIIDSGVALINISLQKCRSRNLISMIVIVDDHDGKARICCTVIDLSTQS